MPIYKLNGETYDIPADVVSDFEKDNPNATVTYFAGGDEYDIPVSERDGFLKDFPDATTDRQQPAAKGNSRQQGFDPSEFSGFIGSVRQTVGQSQQASNRIGNRSQRIGLDIPDTDYGRVNLGQNRKVTTGQQRVNLDTGKLENTYITEAGNEYGTRAEADIEQNAIDEINRRKANPLGTDMEDSYQEGRRLDARIAELEAKRNAATRENNGFVYTDKTAFTDEEDEELQNLKAAKRQNDQRIVTLEREKEDYETSGVFDSIGKAGGDFFRGMYDMARDPSVFSFGITDLADMTQLYKVKRKMDEAKEAGVDPELTDTEQSLLQNTMLNSYAQQQYGKNRSDFYGYGQIAMQAIPFVGEFFLTGGFKTISDIGAKYGAKKAADWALKGWKAAVVKNTGVLAGDLASGWAMANTTGAAKTAADILDRHIGDVYVGEDGNYYFDDGKSLAQAVYEGELVNTFEYYTEKLGDHLNIGGFLARGAEKYGLSKLSKAVSFLSGSKTMKALGVHDYPSEVFEEEANLLLNATFGLDNNFETDPNSKDFQNSVFNGKTQKDIVFGMFFSLGVLNAPRYVQTGYTAAQYKRYQHKVSTADANAASVFGADNWQMIKEQIDNCDNEGMAELMQSVADGGMKAEQKAATSRYAADLMTMRGYNSALMSMISGDEEDVTPQAQAAGAVDQSYIEGYDTQDPDLLKQYVDEANAALRDLSQYGDEFTKMVVLSRDPVSTMSDIMDKRDIYTDDQIAAAADYFQKQAKVNGIMDGALDRIDLQVEQAIGEVRANTHQATGNVYSAKGADDVDYNIISGDIETDPDTGLPVLVGTGGAVVVRDAFGNVSVKSPQELSIYSVQSADVMINDLNTDFREQLTKQADDDITFGSPANEVYQLEDTVTLNDGEGNVIEGQIGMMPNSIDGVYVVYTADNKALQFTADELNRRIVAHNGMEVQRTSSQATEIQQPTEQAQGSAEGQTGGATIQPQAQPAQSGEQTGGKNTIGDQGGESNQPVSALSRIPVLQDEKGRPLMNKKGKPQYLWHKASVEDAAAALIETTGGDMVMARDTASDLVKNAQAGLEKIRRQKPKGEDPIEIAESRMEIRRQEQEQQAVIKQWQDVNQAIQKQMRDEAAARQAEEEAAKTAEQKAREAEEARQREEKQREQDRQRIREQIEKEKERRNKEYQPLVKAREEMAGDADALAILGDTEPRSLEEWVSSLLRPHSILWQDASDTETGLQSELGLTRADMQRMISLLGTRESGAKPFGQAVLDIYQALPEGMRNQYTDQDVRSTLIDLFREGTSARMLHLTEENRIEEANQAVQENMRREAEAEMEAWAETYHLTPEERETFEDFMSQAPSEPEQEIINQIIADNEQNQGSPAVGEQPVSGGNAAGVEGGKGQIRQTAQATSNGNTEQRTGASAETDAGQPSVADNNVPGAESIFVTPILDIELSRKLVNDLSDAYASGEPTAIQKAVTAIRTYVDRGGDFENKESDEYFDYEGDDPMSLALQYKQRVLLNTYLEEDEDQEYIKTGLKPGMRQIAPSEQLKPTDLRDATRVESPEIGVAEANARARGDSMIGRSLTEEEADDLILESAARAEQAPEIELTPENWQAEFGNGILSTPIGDVKLSDNQYSKTIDKGRTKEVGMIKPTLTDPDFIIEVSSKAKDGNTERPTSYLFVKAFVGKDGKKQYFFKSVTVQKDGMEVNVSNHFDRPKRLRESLENGKLLYRFNGGAQTEQSPATVSVTTPQTNPGTKRSEEDAIHLDQSIFAEDGTLAPPTQPSSDGKDTKKSPNIQEKTGKSEQKPQNSFKRPGKDTPEGEILVKGGTILKNNIAGVEAVVKIVGSNIDKKTGKRKYFVEYYASEEEAKAMPSIAIGDEEIGQDDMRQHLANGDFTKKGAAEIQQPTEREQTEPEPEKPNKNEPKRLVSDEKMEELRKQLLDKLNNLNAGIDPEMMLLGAMYAVGNIERGVTKFADYAKKMVTDLGDKIRPYLKSFYNAVRDMPEAQEYASQMDDYATVSGFDVYNFDKQQTPDAITKAEQVVTEQRIRNKAKKIQEQPDLFAGDLFGAQAKAEPKPKSAPRAKAETQQKKRKPQLSDFDSLQTGKRFVTPDGTIEIARVDYDTLQVWDIDADGNRSNRTRAVDTVDVADGLKSGSITEVQSPTESKSEPRLRPATEADVDSADAKWYHNGKRVYILAITRSGEQVSATQFSKPTVESVMLTNGKSVKLGDLMVEDTSAIGETSTHAQIAAEEAKVDTNPSEAQKEAGNYQKGHIKVDGYDITIENPKGSIRRGTDANGKSWETKMNNTYGYIRGTEAVDGDHIDIFLSDDPTSGSVYVVDQNNPGTGEFDEHKVMYGFGSEEEAREAYLANYSKGWKGLGNITEVSREDFKKWIQSSHRKTKPFAEYKSVVKSQKKKSDWWNDLNRPQSIDPKDYKTYMTPEAKEYFAQFKGGKTDFTTWAHPNLAYITAAVWDEVEIPYEELKNVPEIVEAEKTIKNAESKGKLVITDEEANNLAQRLIDREQARQERKALVIIGLPAGGKSSVFANPLAKEFGARIIDSDDVKPWLDGFDGGNGAGYVQDASAEVAEKAIDIAVKNGDNIIIPRIGGKSVMDLSAALRLAGYDVQLYFNDVKGVTSIDRAASRFAQTGRYLSLDYLTKKAGVPSENFSKFAEKTLGGYLDERNQTEVQNIRGRLQRLLGKLDVSGEGLREPSSTEQGGNGTIEELLQADLGGRGQQAGGNGVSLLLKEPLFNYSEWKSNDVPFGQKPKEIWNSESGKPMPGKEEKNNETESKVSRKPESAGQGAGQASGSADRTGAEPGTESDRTQRTGSGSSVEQPLTVPDGGEARDSSKGPRENSTGGITRDASSALPKHNNRRNNVGERGKDYAPLSPKARFNANVEAIKLMRLLNDEGIDAPTKDQMEVLRKYSGWGGMGTFFNDESLAENKQLRDLLSEEEYNDAVMSINSAYYTPAMVIDSLWDIAKAMGFKGGNVLEGSAGIGNIIGQMPKEMSSRSNIEAVEIDSISGNILKLLYPDAKVHIEGFQDVRIPNGTVDLAVTNVPFVTGLHVIDKVDKDLSRKFTNIHDFCIAKNIRKLREGGIGIFITSAGTMDKSTKLREWITDEGQADVVGAFRLNNATFGGTNVTSDIIVVRKRTGDQKSSAAIDVAKASPIRVGTWTDKDGDDHQVSMVVNDYFRDNPDMMAGEMAFGYEKGDTFRPGSYGLYPVSGKEQEKMLAGFAKSMVRAKEEAAALPQRTERQAETNQLTAEKEGRMLIDDKGRLCVSQRGIAVPLGLNDQKVKGHTKAECFADYQAVQKAVDDVLQQQLNDPDDSALKPKLDALNKAYDKFNKRYGTLHKNTSIAFLRNDIDFPSFQALENYSETKDVKGKVTVKTAKTPLFSQRVLGFKTEPEPKNVKDALIASIFRSNGIDLGWIAERLNAAGVKPPHKDQWDEDDVRKGILVSRLGFEDPSTGQLEIRYKYLSGNVREKLAIAEAYNTDGKYAANVEELRKAVPMDIPSHLIDFSLGSSWIPIELYKDYLKQTYDLENVKLTHIEGSWILDEGYSYRNEKNRSAGVYSEQFRETIYGHQLVAAALNNRPVKVAKQVTEGWGNSKTTKTVVDQAATQACAVRVDEIKDEFKQWAKKKMQDDPELARRIEKIYNDKFNALVPMQIDDEFLPDVFENANMNIHLYDHQKRGVMRGLTSPTMLAHEVGTGKSFTLISTAMEMRRLGTAKKPMIVVQNATVAQMTADAKLLYPNAKVLSLTEKDRDAEGRRSFYAKIKYNDWDLIIVPQSTFERIPDSPERELQFIQEKIDEKKHVIEAAEAAGADSRQMQQMRRELEKLEQEYGDTFLNNDSANIASKLSQPTGRKKKDAKKEAASLDKAETKAKEMLDRAVDDVQYFDDLGVDALLVDEAHEYKHLGFQTSIGRGIKGIDPSYSKKCAGLYNKTRSVFEKAGWKNVVFATGTPISNTAAEIWTFMKYLMPADVMRQNDIYYFDDFVHNFGSISQMLEFATSGKFKENTRFAAYVNKPELIRIWSQVADTVLTKEVGEVKSKVPEKEGGKDQDVFLPQSPSLISIMAAVRAELERFENMDGKQKKENSHIPLTMYGIAKRAAIDPRLVNADAPDEPLSKTNAAVKEIVKDLKATESYKGTVAVFCDNQNRKGADGSIEFNIYDDMREKLVKEGVPANQIAIIKSGMSIAAKQKVFDAVNSGGIRVVLGSTQTLGTGVNMQERLHLLIHMDAPDRPMDYTQRNGRIERQGNLHKAWGKPIRILRFGVEDSLDVTAYQRLKTKSGFIDSIMDGKGALLNNQVDRTVEEEEEGLFDNPVAVLSGSQYALKKNQAERELRKYQSKKAQWEADQVYVTNTLRYNQVLLSSTEQNIKEQESKLAKMKGMFPGGKVKTITVEGIRIDMTKDDGAKKLGEAIKEKINEPVNATVKKLRENQIYNDETQQYTIELDGHAVNFTVSIYRTSEWDGGKMKTVLHKGTSYSSPDLQTDSMMSARGVRDYLDEILDTVVTGRDSLDRIEAYRARVERVNAENEQMRQREGQPFQFDKELETARKNVEEYTQLMKKEMEEKEAKYAAQQAEAKANGESFNLSKAEENSEEEDDVLRRSDDDYDENELIYRVRDALEEKYPGFNTAYEVEEFDGQYEVYLGDRQAAIDLYNQNFPDAHVTLDESGAIAGSWHYPVYIWGVRQFDEMMKNPSLQLADGTPLNPVVSDAEQKRESVIHDGNFKIFFGDWEKNPENASKVVDAEGKPLIIYHGTNLTRVNSGKPFWEFYAGSHFGTFGQSRHVTQGRASEGDLTKTYPVYLNIRNPKRVSDVPADWEETHSEWWEKQIRTAKEQGYDGLVYLNKYEDPQHPADSWVAFYPEQIKSAVDNVGTYDPTKRDIRYRATEQFGEGEAFPIHTDYAYSSYDVTGRRAIYSTDLLPDAFTTPQALLDAVRNQYPEYFVTIEDGQLKMQSWAKVITGAANARTKAKGKESYINRKTRQAIDAVEQMAKRMNLDVEVLTSTDGLSEQNARSKGLFNRRTHKITIILPNHRNVQDVINTLLHEGVAHYGLRKMFGASFNTFLDNVYNNVDPEIRARIDATMKRNGWSRHEATEEYLARLAERTDFEHAQQSGWWQKIKDFFLDMLAKAGFNTRLSDNELRYILWSSYDNLLHPDSLRNIFDTAREIQMQSRLRVGRYERERKRIQRTGRVDTSRVVADRVNEEMLNRDIENVPSQELLLSLSQKEGDERNEAINELIRRIRKGDARIVRMGREIPVDRGNDAQIAGTILGLWGQFRLYALADETLRGVVSSGSDVVSGSQTQNKDIEADCKLALISWAKASGSYISEREVEANSLDKDVWRSGAESRVYRTADGKKAIKFMESWVYFQNPLLKRMEGIALQNAAGFDHLNILGYTLDEHGELLVVLEQNIVDGVTVDEIFDDEPLSKQHRWIDSYLENKFGLERKTDADGNVLHMKDGIVYKDLHGGNIIMDNKGKYHIIDCYVSLAEDDKKERAEGFSIEDNVQDILRRSDDDYDIARAAYEKAAASDALKFQEAWQDKMASLKVLQNAIEEETGKKATGAEDAYLYENRMHGKAKNQSENYDRRYYRPMLKAADAMMKANGWTEMRELTDYLVAKHGLERNIFYAFKEAVTGMVRDNINKEQRKLTKRYERGEIDALTYKKEQKELAERESKDIADKIAEVHNNPEHQRMLTDYKNGRITYSDYITNEEDIRRSYAPDFDEHYKDYSGLTELTGDENDYTHLALAMVDEAEKDSQEQVTDLWDAINAATKETLRFAYESGTMSRSIYNNVREMFDYYVPLRGWEENNADDYYDYVSERNVFSTAIKKAYGRQSLAENPLAYIGNMAVSTLLAGHKNLLKQHFLNYVMNNPTSLVSVSERWFENKGTETSPYWVEVAPEIPAGATADQIADIVEAFNEDMKQKASEGKATTTRGRLDIMYHATGAEKDEHMVEVQRAGKTYKLYINGNPKAAQALNGINEKAVSRISQTDFGKMVESINRSMAAFFTSKNPAFVLSNLSRDLTMAGASVAVKEDAAYNAQFIKNVFKVLRPRAGRGGKYGYAKLLTAGRYGKNTVGITGLLPSLMRKYIAGDLDLTNETERLFGEFMDEGGETGFVNMLSVDSFKEKMQKEIGQMQGTTLNIAKARKGTKETPVGKGLRLMGDIFEFYNRCAEDATRFIVYMTSRQMGKSLEDSIADAKDVTLNFNRKGAGAKWNAVVRDLFIFVNPAIQALANMFKMAYKHPLKLTAVTAAFMAGGALIPIFNQWLLNLFGDDDDKDSYWNLPPWVRKNNLVVWVPGTKNFITIPLAQEFRVFYGLGEMATSLTYDHPVHEWPMEILSSFMDLVPINPTGNNGNLVIDLTPTMFQPVSQLAFNTDFTGKPIWRENQGNKYAPMYTKAYVSTPEWMINLSEGMNSLTGGNEGKKGWVEEYLYGGDYINNPAVWNHLMQGYFGGMYNTIAKAFDVGVTAAKGEMPKVYQTPVVNRFLNRPVERDNAGALGDEYYGLIEERDRLKYELRTWQKKADDGDADAQRHVDGIMQGEDYQRMLVIDHYDRIMQDLKAGEKAARADFDKEDIRDMITMYKAQMMDELADIDGGTDPLEAAKARFNAATTKAERARLKKRIERLTMRQGSSGRGSDDAVGKALSYRSEELDADREGRSESASYLKLATADDIADDARIKNARAMTKPYLDRFRELERVDGAEAARYRSENLKWFRADEIIRSQSRAMNNNKKLLGKGHDEAIMKLIDANRQRMLNAIEGLE